MLRVYLRVVPVAVLVLVALLIGGGLDGVATAGTTGAISGSVFDDATKALIAGATVTVASPSGHGSSTTDAHGFFTIFGLSPDTYTISVSASGYQAAALAGVNVQQDQTVTVNERLQKTLRTIGRTSARSASNLNVPGQTSDVYNVSADQLGAAAGGGGSRNLYQVIQTVPGITSTGFAGRPRIRGSDVGDVAWEFDGIPLNDRLTGLFTSNLSIAGTQNIEVYTGGFSAQYGNAAAGVINSVVKRGTYPGFGSFTYTSQLPLSEHDVIAEYGGATANGRFSWYGSADYSNADNQFANGYPGYSVLQATNGSDTDPSTITSRDFIGNFHYKPDDRDDFQFLIQSGNQKIPWDKGLPPTAVGVTACSGVVVTPGNPPVITNPGVSASGAPCNKTGLQYIPVSQQTANVWYHWSNLGKIQWNHSFSDKLFGQFHLAENFNQYIFNQPLDAANFDRSLVPGTPATTGGAQDEYSDRRSQIYIGAFDLTYAPNANATYKAGISYERDTSAENYYDYCGCDDAGTGSPFNNNGTYPNLFLAVDYPLYLPSAYLDTHQTFGKLSVEPSIRWDRETYAIPNNPDPAAYAQGPYGVQTFSPRFAFSYAFNSNSSLRGSYGITSTFVPAAYVFNNSPNGIDAQDGRLISPYYPGSDIKPQIDHNIDLGYAQSITRQDSFRVSPFYHLSGNKLAYTRQYVVNPDGTVVAQGPTLFKTGIVNKATGFEFGFNHVVLGDGLSSYLSGTFTNYWGSVTSGTLAGGTPYGRFVNPQEFALNASLYRNSSQPPWTVSYTALYTHGHFHAAPYINYQVGAPYNTLGDTSYVDPSTGLTVVDTAVHFARATYYASIDLSYDIVKRRRETVTIGLDILNAFNNNYADVYPVQNLSYPKSPSTSDFANYGPNGALPNTLYYYSPDQTPRQFQLYMAAKF